MEYFTIKEFVSRKMFENNSEEELWKLLDPKLLKTISWLRERLGPMRINTWASGGDLEQRGYRGKDCTIGAVHSAHKEGKALDFDVKGMTSEQVRQWIELHQEELPYPIRYEDRVTWCHIDTREVKDDRAYEFQP